MVKAKPIESNDEPMFEVEDPSDTRSEPGSYNQLVFAQIGRISRLIPQVAEKMVKNRYSLVVLYYTIKDLDLKLKPLRRQNKEVDYSLNVLVKEIPFADYADKIDFMNQLIEWHEKQMNSFSRVPGVLPAKDVELNMGTGEMKDA